MNVIKYFFKNLRANYVVLLINIAIFVVILFAYTVGTVKQNGSVFEPTKANIALIKSDDSEVANAVEEYLSDYMGDGKQPDILEDDLDKAREKVYMGYYDAIVRIPSGAGENFENDLPTVEVLFNTMQHEGHIIDNRLKVFMVIYKSTWKDGHYDLELAKSILKQEASVEFMQSEQTPEHEVQRIWVQTFFNTGGYVLMSLYISLIGMGVSSFGEKKTKLRISISSKDSNEFQAEIYTAQLILGAIITTLFIGICFILNGKALLSRDPLKFILNIVTYSIVLITLTFWINNVTNNNHTKNGLTILSLGFAFISGIFIPQSMLGEEVLAVAKFFPLYYFIQVNETVSPKLPFLLQNLGIQLLFGVLFFVLGLYFAKKRRLVG